MQKGEDHRLPHKKTNECQCQIPHCHVSPPLERKQLFNSGNASSQHLRILLLLNTLNAWLIVPLGLIGRGSTIRWVVYACIYDDHSQTQRAHNSINTTHNLFCENDMIVSEISNGACASMCLAHVYIIIHSLVNEIYLAFQHRRLGLFLWSWWKGTNPW